MVLIPKTAKLMTFKQLTSWCRILREKLKLTQLWKKLTMT